MIVQIFWVVLILFIWFSTDAFIQYSKVLKLSKYFRIEEWESYRISNPKIGYLDYLVLKHKSFFTKLISCKPCFNFWITLTICLIFGTLVYYPVIYISSYIIYKLIDKYV